MRKIAVVLVAGVLAAAPLGAQQEPDTIHHRNRCRLAAQIAETGQPAPHRDWAYRQLSTCGKAGALAVVRGLERLRTSEDQHELRAITEPVRWLHDAGIYAASLDLAEDRTASQAARAFAFRNLVWFIRPHATLDGFDPWAERRGAGCIGATAGQLYIVVDPLPSDSREEIKAAALRVIRNPEESRAIRNAAYCALLNGSWTDELWPRSDGALDRGREPRRDGIQDWTGTGPRGLGGARSTTAAAAQVSGRVSTKRAVTHRMLQAQSG